jgi:hypothetical protein
MSQLSRRKAGRRDNNEAGGTSWFERNMAWRIESILERQKVSHYQSHQRAIHFSQLCHCFSTHGQNRTQRVIDAQFNWRCEPQVGCGDFVYAGCIDEVKCEVM